MKKAFLALLGAVVMAHSMSMTAAAVNYDNPIMQNDYLTLYVGQEEYNYGRYQLSAHRGDLKNDEDDKKNLMYDNFYSSYTTIVLNGKPYRFGEGKIVSAPYYDAADDLCMAVQSFGALEVTQTLRFADGMGTGHDDMLLVSYTVTNTAEEEVLVGCRIMIDSQLDRDDKGILKVDDALLDFEKEYDSTIPSVWSVTAKDQAVTAYGKVKTVPDRMVLADWSSLFDKKWGYAPDGAKDIEDSAAALIWDNRLLSAGQSNEYAVYYGVKNLSASSEPSEPSTPSEPTSEPSTPSEPTSAPSEPSEPTSAPSEPSDPSAVSVMPASDPVSTADGQTSAQVSVREPLQDAPLTGQKGIAAVAAAAALTLLLGVGVAAGISKKGGSRHEK